MPPPNQDAPQPPQDGDKNAADLLDARITSRLNTLLLPYTVWAKVLATVIIAGGGFFGFKAWPDFQEKIKTNTETSIQQQVKTSVQSVRASIDQELSDYRSRATVRMAELEQRVTTNANAVYTMLGAHDQKIQTEMAKLEDQRVRYEAEIKQSIQGAREQQQVFLTELDRMEKQRHNLDTILEGIQAAQKLISENVAGTQNRLQALHLQEADLQARLTAAGATSADLEKRRMEIEERITQLGERSKAVALLLNEEEFVMALRKLRTEMFRIQSLDARVSVSIPGKHATAMKRPGLAAPLSRLQVNLMKQGGKGDWVEFVPADPTRIESALGEDDKLIEYVSTGIPYELFVPAYRGKELSVLDGVDLLWLASTSIGEEEHAELRADIEHFYANCTVTVQIYVNGMMVAEKIVEKPKFQAREEEQEGTKHITYHMDMCELGGCLENARKTYEQRLLSLN